MQGMADASGGNYYYVDSPDDMSRIFQQEAARSCAPPRA